MIMHIVSFTSAYRQVTYMQSTCMCERRRQDDDFDDWSTSESNGDLPPLCSGAYRWHFPGLPNIVIR